MPPPQVAQLSQEDKLSSYGQKLFYVYHPQIETSAQFNQNCKVSPQEVVLGCTVINKNIYLYNVTDSQLNGVMQVTAAYEMLHVGYSRLSTSERKYIDGLVLEAYNEDVKTDPVLAQERQSYLKTEGQGAVANELHSMMGTEVENLPPALANYYSRYFTNRQVIVGYENEYQAVFVSRQNEINTDDTQLSTWNSQINSDEATLDTERDQLTTMSNQLNDYRNDGEIDSYNNGVNSYNTQVNSYNALVIQAKALINNYNQLVIARNSISVQEDQLDKAISSQPSTISTQ
jgi:hypothetical protein